MPPCSRYPLPEQLSIPVGRMLLNDCGENAQGLGPGAAVAFGHQKGLVSVTITKCIAHPLFPAALVVVLGLATPVSSWDPFSKGSGKPCDNLLDNRAEKQLSFRLTGDHDFSDFPCLATVRNKIDDWPIDQPGQVSVCYFCIKLQERQKGFRSFLSKIAKRAIAEVTASTLSPCGTCAIPTPSPRRLRGLEPHCSVPGRE